jgi:hypothetical protein
MASNINTTDINTSYPVAGQDNDTQGFRDNWANIVENLQVAAAEITNLQANATAVITSTSVPVSLTAAGTTGQVAFDVNYFYICIGTNNWVKIPNTTGTGSYGTVQLASLTQTQVNAITPSNGMMLYNSTNGNVQAYTAHLGRWGNVVIS